MGIKSKIEAGNLKKKTLKSWMHHSKYFYAKDFARISYSSIN